MDHNFNNEIKILLLKKQEELITFRNSFDARINT